MTEKEIDPKKEFQRICDKAKALGITPEQLAKLDSVKRLQKCLQKKAAEKEDQNKKNNILLWVLIPTLFALFSSVYRYELHTAKGFTKFLFDWYKLDLEYEQCTIPMPEMAVDIFRPPVNCDMCRNVTEVERVTAISPTEFQEKFAYSGRPVVITDAANSWSALKEFSFNFFKSLYDKSSPVLENFDTNCQFFPYRTEFTNLREVFNMSEERAQMKEGTIPWYIGWSNCDSSATNILRQHYERPYFLPLDAESSRVDWIFMGSPGYGAFLHVDHVGNPSWQAQITGQKIWTLVPPPECHLECTILDTTLEPGNIIVVDTNRWYHKTLIIGKEMSITIGSEYD